MKKLAIFCIIALFFSTEAFAAVYISKVSESQTLNGQKTTALLWAKINPPTGVTIKRVWIEIYSPVGDISSFDLSDPDNNFVYEGIYADFTLQGVCASFLRNRHRRHFL